MSINIRLTPSEERKLTELARAMGKDADVYAHEVISAYLETTNVTELMTIEEIVSPIWDEWRKSGLTDSEIDDLFEQELHATRNERRVENGTP